LSHKSQSGKRRAPKCQKDIGQDVVLPRQRIRGEGKKNPEETGGGTPKELKGTGEKPSVHSDKAGAQGVEKQGGTLVDRKGEKHLEKREVRSRE